LKKIHRSSTESAVRWQKMCGLIDSGDIDLSRNANWLPSTGTQYEAGLAAHRGLVR
jgi:hypothetical protein